MQKIGIIGCGAMGSQLSLAFLGKGFDVIVFVRNIDKIQEYIEIINCYNENTFWKRYLGQQNLDIEKIRFTSEILDLNESELIIETITEKFDQKVKIIKQINTLKNSKVIVATNTSSLLVGSLAINYAFPSNFIGLHFFNPISQMKLVEITKLDKTKNSIIEKIQEVTTQLNKQNIVIGDNAGSLINRFIIPFYFDVIREFEKNKDNSPHEIDNAIKLGCNHPLVPMELFDILGIDVILDCGNNIYNATGDIRFKPPEILIDKVKNNHLGLKTNLGFYNWENNQKVL